MISTAGPTLGLCLVLGAASVAACATGPHSSGSSTAHPSAESVDGGGVGIDGSERGPSSPPIGVDATSEGADAHAVDDGGSANEAGSVDDGGSAHDVGSVGDAGSINDEGSPSPAEGGPLGPDVFVPPQDAGSDGALVASADPFDPTSCSGTPLTLTQAAQLFQSGATQSIVGSYTVEMRQRSCTAVTGCGAWGTPTTSIAATLGQLGLNRSLSGQIVLDVQGSSIALSLVDSTEELPSMMGATCGAVDGTPQQCSDYEYDLGDQWGGSGGLFPTLEPLIDANGKNVVFAGTLTSACLRLSYSAMDTNGNDVQDYVIFAPVAPGSPPPVNPCPGGGVPMGCDGQSGTGACCQEGTQTCPGAGCDCWSACN